MKLIITESQLRTIVEHINTFPEPVIYIEQNDRAIFMVKNEFYIWLYNVPDAVQKMQSGEIQPVFFPPAAPYQFRNNRNVPLTKIWSKNYLKKYAGSEHLLGVIKGFYNEEENMAYIDMMTVNKESRRQGINSYMIQKLREKLHLDQDQITFDDPTDMGKKFMKAKKY